MKGLLTLPLTGFPGLNPMFRDAAHSIAHKNTDKYLLSTVFIENLTGTVSLERES
jgi:hypothetical protein